MKTCGIFDSTSLGWPINFASEGSSCSTGFFNSEYGSPVMNLTVTFYFHGYVIDTFIIIAHHNFKSYVL